MSVLLFLNINPFQPNVPFPYPLKNSQKPSGFQAFSGAIKMKHWVNIGSNHFGKAKVAHGITYHDHVIYHKIV